MINKYLGINSTIKKSFDSFVLELPEKKIHSI